MRYFVLTFVFIGLLVLSLAGFRGQISRKPPLFVFPDMDRQPKYQPQHESDFFADNRTSRLPVPGTVARGSAVQDIPLNTGLITGSTNYVEVNPMAITPDLLEQGRGRFGIYCAPCHGQTGAGDGITTRFGMAIIANLNDPRIVAMPDGELFDVITNGRNQMAPYADKLSVEDRWAVIAYLRALQLARLGSIEDVPQSVRQSLTQ